MAETDQTEIEEQLAVWEARGDGKAAQEEPRRRAKVIQLPLWPETKRGAINAVLRSALFAAIQGKGRVALDRELVAAQHGIEVRLTGWQPSRSDLGGVRMQAAAYYPVSNLSPSTQCAVHGLREFHTYPLVSSTARTRPASGVAQVWRVPS